MFCPFCFAFNPQLEVLQSLHETVMTELSKVPIQVPVCKAFLRASFKTARASLKISIRVPDFRDAYNRV